MGGVVQQLSVVVTAHDGAHGVSYAFKISEKTLLFMRLQSTLKSRSNNYLRE